jgi:hypothetical protein
MSLLAGVLLLVGTGCSVLTPLVAGAGGQVHSVDPAAPFVVVTVGGVAQATATPVGVAPTIPDSTPLPKVDLPTPDAAATPRPVASPSLNRGASAAAQSARPPDAGIPTISASPATRP